MQNKSKKKMKNKRWQSMQQWANYALHIFKKGWDKKREIAIDWKVKIIITGIFPYAQVRRKEEEWCVHVAKISIDIHIWIENELNLITIECHSERGCEIGRYEYLWCERISQSHFVFFSFNFNILLASSWIPPHGNNKLTFTIWHFYASP